MEHRVSYTVIGAFVIVLAGVLVAALLWLASGGLGRHHVTYALYLKNGAALLSPGSPVLYNGVPVGQVSSISLAPTNPSEAQVLLSILEDVPVKTDTRAEVETRGVTGSGYVNLKGGSVQAPLLAAKPGEQYPEIEAQSGGFASVTVAAKQVARRLLEISDRLQRVLSDKNIAALSASVSNIQEVTANLADESKQLNAELTNLSAILANADSASAKLPALMDEVRATVASFHRFTDRATMAASGVGDTAARLRALTPEAQVLLSRLNEAVQNLDALIQSLNQQPSAVIFGKKAKPGPGESGGGD